jgi:type I restriction enzyme S subunit
MNAVDSESEDAVVAHGIKVSDMNLPGNEREITHANLARRIKLSLATRKLIPSETVTFPKRGAAIATNKKRLATTWTVLDPNLIGVRTKPGLDYRYLFYWFEQFDLRTITEPGPTPQLNKKNLTPLLLPIPATEGEQRAIANALATIDRKLAHHQHKRATLNDLFQTLLHQLMTARIRVADLDIDTSEVANHFVDPNKMVDATEASHMSDHLADANKSDGRETRSNQRSRPR